MKTLFRTTLGLLLAVAPLRADSPQVGDSYASVIATKGQPEGRAGIGATLILNYPDSVITLKDGTVTSVRPTGEEGTTVPERKVTEAEKRRAAAEQAAADRTAPGAAAAWTTDYAAALAAARAQNRRVFLFFTGSDWCGWCIRLNREVLATPEFAAYAGEKLVLVDLDFPRRKELPAAVREQNEKLAKQHGIRGFPTVIVLNPQGRVIGRLGYQPGGPKAYIEALERL